MSSVGYRKGQKANFKAGYEAQATWWEKWNFTKGRWRRKPNCGQILFHAKRIGVGIVSHEMTHAAAFYIAWDRKLDPHPDNRVAHEKLCIIQGWLVTQFWRHFYKKHPAELR